MKQLKDWRYEVDFEGIAWAIFDREGESMNTLGRRPTEELAEIIQRTEEAASRGEVAGLVFMSGKESSFIAGADIREFDNMKDEQAVTEAVKATIELFDRIERMKIPVVAAINGFCRGGG
ncbi:MAG: enoyl-CoA hydratase-related protein, partial [Hyphomicrobiales bacterium]